MPSSNASHYIGRFAPTPSGSLHFGSLIAACASYLDAKSRQGQWLLRIDDLDPPRVKPGAIESILHTLEFFQFEWDQSEIYQSQRQGRYQEAIDELFQNRQVFACDCSRKQLFARQPNGIYDGFCRHRDLTPRPNLALRFRQHDNTPLILQDQIQGHYDLKPQSELGDFIVRRADGLYGYQLACAVDDLDFAISHIVRGHDLLASSLAQIQVIYALKGTPPSYAHHPLALNAEGEKLSKSKRALALDERQAPMQLWQALFFLGQNPPQALRYESLHTQWQWAKQHWKLQAIAPQATLTLDPD